MPFIQRIIEPKYLSRKSLHSEDGKPLVTDCELEAVINNTLSNALRQLASLILVANDIFSELTKELQKVTDRSSILKVKIGLVYDQLAGYDPKKIPVPEGDLNTFALLRNHYHKPQEVTTNLFGAETRPTALQSLYEAAALSPVHTMRQLDRWRHDGHRSSRFFLCTPVFGAKRRKIHDRVDIDIETRLPAAVNELRRWTSSEAIGDITVSPDYANRITSNTTVEYSDNVDNDGLSKDDEGIDHKLPSPEEQLQVLALKFPAEIVPVDVSGKRFDRLSVQRRSLVHVNTINEEDSNGTVKRRSRSRKPRGKRRNTLAGTDHKEIQDALTIGDEPSVSNTIIEPELSEIEPVIRSRSIDILESKKDSLQEGKKSHFSTLKQWGRSRLKLINKSLDSKSTESNKIEDIDDINLYETITVRRRKNNSDKGTKLTHECKTSYSSSEKSSSISLPISTPFFSTMNIAVKLRESSAQRRRRNKDEQHSSSGNWSASSESGRASIGSEITNTTHPKSSTSVATSNNSLNPPSSINSRRKFINTSTSSSVASEGTLTPDIIHDIPDDGETSSVYSCDTEGYYTSFHVDSGLKTLKEEESGLPIIPLHTTSAFSNSIENCTVLTAENEYELFGKGSTSTTTSSAGTVCTTLRASESNRSLLIGPTVPERKSSLNSSGNNSLEREFSSDKTGTVKRSPATTSKATTVVAMVHKQSSGDVSPDSGHNTSSSPIESVSSPNGAPSCSDFEFSESSDLEGVERIERIRIKTTINSSRIPFMCVITPPQSDDESEKSSKNCTKNNLNISNLASKNINRRKLNLPLQTLETNLDDIKNVDTIQSPSNENNKMQIINVNPTSGYATIETVLTDTTKLDTIDGKPIDKNSISSNSNCQTISPQPIIKSTLMPLSNMKDKLKYSFSNYIAKKENPIIKEIHSDDLTDSGDYVTIADVRNNNEKVSLTCSNVVYANETIKSNQRVPETEYVSLNDLTIKNSDFNIINSDMNSLERNRQGARVTLDADGKVVYSSNSLKHSTFEPGPFVKTVTPTATPLSLHRTPKVIRPVNSQEKKSQSVSPQMKKVVIRANSKLTTDCVRNPPTNIIVPSMISTTPIKIPGARGAYVHMQEDWERSLLSTDEEERTISPSRYQQNMHPQTADYYYRGPDCQNSLQYKTLPSRIRYRNTNECSKTSDITRSLLPQYNKSNVNRLQGGDIYNKEKYQFNSLPRRLVQTSQNISHNQQLSFSTANQNNYSNMVNYVKQIEVPSHTDTNKLKLKMESNNITIQNDSLKISPIDPRNSGCFQSSTPIKLNENSPIVNFSNTLISPKKSTMSNEALYAMIHKSKKKLNIKTDDIENISGISSISNLSLLSEKATTGNQPETGYIGEARNRNSWSPNIDNRTLSQPGSRQSWACVDRIGHKQTSRLDFKKLLLQHGSRSNIVSNSNSKMSAVEQLKLSKNQKTVVKQPPVTNMNILDLSASPRSFVNKKLTNLPPGSPEKQRPQSKLLSLRSNWKFANPRSDVLSSTILEDCCENESSHIFLEKLKPVNNSSTIEAENNLEKHTISTFDKKSKHVLSRSQMLQAKRAEFFKSTNQNSDSNVFFRTDGRIKKCSSPPTLETAL